MNRQKVLKKASNDAYADRFKRRRRKDRKKARKERVIERERRWFEDSGIPIDPTRPLA
jgi:hypothetical protein